MPESEEVPAAAPDDGEGPVPGDQDLIDADLLERIAPMFRSLRTYTRLKVSGLDNIPEDGRVMLAGNHTGWLGLDAALTVLSVHDGIERLPRPMAHAAWFANSQIAGMAKRLGIYKIDKDTMRRLLERDEIILIFPEGEKGAFRPGSDYTLESFARGFVRVAMESQCPVVPTCILGGEESNPVGTRIESYEQLLHLRGGLPIPKNLIPKPVKWMIRFLPPIDFSGYTAEDAGNKELVHELAEETRDRIQKELRKMKLERGHPYL